MDKPRILFSRLAAEAEAAAIHREAAAIIGEPSAWPPRITKSAKQPTPEQLARPVTLASMLKLADEMGKTHAALHRRIRALEEKG